MDRRKRLLYALKAVILILLFCTAVYFENAQRQRFFVLVSVFALYFSVGIARRFLSRGGRMYCLSFFIDVILTYILEYNSRLLINYFLHSFYIITLLEAVLTMDIKRGIAAGTIAALVSLIKYAYLVYYRSDLSSISQLAFFLLVNVLILVTACFARQNREEKERKDELYRELLDAHRQLKQYTDEVNRLIVVEERNQIARDIHDSLGHSMTALIMQLQMAEHFLKEDAQKAGQLFENCVKTARDSLGDIRKVVETLREADTLVDPEESVKRLVNEFSDRTGTEIVLDMKGEVVKDSAVNIAVYRIIQEAVTNAVRHGRASKVSVELVYSDSSVEFCVRDNGSGTEVLKEGYGLKGIRERVETFGGKVEFGTGQGLYQGFYIKGILYTHPLAG